MDPQRAAYDELYAYTMTRGREQFILQHVVDAGGAQFATDATKPIGIVFALVGLYLHVERGLSGRQVQDVHRRLGRTKRGWPAIVIPSDRGRITAADVLAKPLGSERDVAIDVWCASVWGVYADANRAVIIDLLRQANVAGV